MEIIYDKFHKPISKSQNLRGIRSYVSKNLVKEIRISKAARNFSGTLFVSFEDGAYYKTHFASFEILKNFIKQWRNVYGVQLYVNRRGAGKISYQNPNL